MQKELTTTSEGWDWEWLWFAGTFILKFDQDAFWRLTPRQLEAYTRQFTLYNETKYGTKKNKKQPATSQDPDKVTFTDDDGFVYAFKDQM